MTKLDNADDTSKVVRNALVDILPGIATAVGVAKATDPACVYYVVGTIAAVLYTIYLVSYSVSRLSIVAATLLFIHQLTGLLQCVWENGNPYIVGVSIVLSPLLLFNPRARSKIWTGISICVGIAVLVLHGTAMHHPTTLQIVSISSYASLVGITLVM
jgi:hypothetical protein